MGSKKTAPKFWKVGSKWKGSEYVVIIAKWAESLAAEEGYQEATNLLPWWLGFWEFWVPLRVGVKVKLSQESSWKSFYKSLPDPSSNLYSRVTLPKEEWRSHCWRRFIRATLTEGHRIQLGAHIQNRGIIYIIYLLKQIKHAIHEIRTGCCIKGVCSILKILEIKNIAKYHLKTQVEDKN